jgi:hypothetical protein
LIANIPLPIPSLHYRYGRFIAETIHICRLDHVPHGPMVTVAMWMSALSCLGGSDQRELLLTRDSGLAVPALQLPCLCCLGNEPWLLWPPSSEEFATLSAPGYGEDVLQLSRPTED